MDADLVCGLRCLRHSDWPLVLRECAAHHQAFHATAYRPTGWRIACRNGGGRSATEQHPPVGRAADREMPRTWRSGPVEGIFSALHAPAKPLPIIVLGTMILSYSSA